jgi:hypothetical protein
VGDPGCALHHARTQYLEQPGGGSLRFTDNGGDPVEIQTDAPAGPGTFSYYLPGRRPPFRSDDRAERAGNSAGMGCDQPGVTWESIGINGAEAPLILKWDQTLFSRYLKDNSPA